MILAIRILNLVVRLLLFVLRQKPAGKLLPEEATIQLHLVQVHPLDVDASHVP
jgi:hypothetical protein